MQEGPESPKHRSNRPRCPECNSRNLQYVPKSRPPRIGGTGRRPARKNASMESLRLPSSRGQPG
eukprot:61532-Pyramimonas_sp.AAC.1